MKNWKIKYLKKWKQKILNFGNIINNKRIGLYKADFFI